MNQRRKGTSRSFAGALLVAVFTVSFAFTTVAGSKHDPYAGLSGEDLAAVLSSFHTRVIGDEKRVKGTSKERRTAKYIAFQLRLAGYNPRLQRFDAATGELIGPEKKRYGPRRDQVISYNVIAEKKGSVDPERVLVLGAHLDSVPQNDGTGYSDNGAGAGVGLGVAQVLAKQDLPFTTVFVFFGAEESCPSYIDYCVDSGLAGTGGKKGSTAYTSTFTPQQVNDTVAMLNLDTVVGGDFLYAHGASEGSDGWVRERLLEIAAEARIDLRINPGYPIDYADGKVLYPRGTTGDWGDHFPFEEKGVEIGFIEATNWDIGDLDGYEQSEKLLNETGDGAIWHTDRDIFKFLKKTFPGRVQRQNREAVALVYRFLRDPQPPAELSPGALARREASICAEVIGKKVAGTSGELAMRDYILERLLEMGYDADIQPFEIPEDADYSGGETSFNVFAVKPGQSPTESGKEFVIGSHYDSVPQNDGNGYTDNCAGTGTNLALADVLQDEAVPVTVRFIFFGAEELGKIGSEAYVDAMDGASTGVAGEPLGDIDDVEGMLNLDTPWGGDFNYVHGASEGNEGWIREALLSIAEAKRYQWQENPGNFISVAYWYGGNGTVPQDTACVTGETYDTKAAEEGEPLTVDDFDSDELIDTSDEEGTDVSAADYCVFLPEGTTGDWSDHFPFQAQGKEIGYIEATNWDIGDFDGYQQSAELLEEFENCIASGGDTDDCGDAAGAIWHTDRDEYGFLNETFPSRIQRQSTEIMEVLLAFLRAPELPLVASVPPSAEVVSARSSDVRERILRRGLRVRLKALVEDLGNNNESIDLLIEALKRRDVNDSVLIKRIPPEAVARLEELREEFGDLLRETP